MSVGWVPEKDEATEQITQASIAEKKYSQQPYGNLSGLHLPLPPGETAIRLCGLFIPAGK